mmetsp:Transcript_8542/g.18769  ORF Transcript_8542/g.18769 Transcript_8542/m.18769 type:complete len:200 (+) Transcript_8542:630-1229(+)
MGMSPTKAVTLAKKTSIAPSSDLTAAVLSARQAALSTTSSCFFASSCVSDMRGRPALASCSSPLSASSRSTERAFAARQASASPVEEKSSSLCVPCRRSSNGASCSLSASRWRTKKRSPWMPGRLRRTPSAPLRKAATQRSTALLAKSSNTALSTTPYSWLSRDSVCRMGGYHVRYRSPPSVLSTPGPTVSLYCSRMSG